MIEIPSYPLTKPKESDAYEDWEKLLNTSFVNLFEHKPWKSRSVIDDDYCYDYIIKKSNIGNKSSNTFHWQARMACDSLTAPSPIRAWYDRKLRNRYFDKGVTVLMENPRAEGTLDPNLPFG